MFDEIGLFPELPRGADTVFVRRVVDRYGCAAVSYSPAVRVRHLEMDGVRTYYRKMFLYGRHRRLTQNVETASALSLGSASRCCAGRVDERGYTAVRSAGLSTLLAGGLVAWKLGQLSSVARPAAAA